MAPLLLAIFSLPLIGFWLWMLLDLSNNKYLTRESKNTWFLYFILLNIFGAAWYYLVEYRPRNM
jgi:hypothetical protein